MRIMIVHGRMSARDPLPNALSERFLGAEIEHIASLELLQRRFSQMRQWQIREQNWLPDAFLVDAKMFAEFRKVLAANPVAPEAAIISLPDPPPSELFPTPKPKIGEDPGPALASFLGLLALVLTPT